MCQYGATDLQVADGRCGVDLQVGEVGGGHREAISVPNHCGSGVSLHLAADVGRVPLPRVPRHVTLELRSICRQHTRGGKLVNIPAGMFVTLC